MSRAVPYDMLPHLYIHLNHSLSEWLENRPNRATFAALSFISSMTSASQIEGVDSNAIGTLIGSAVEQDTIYILRIKRFIAALFLAENGALLAQFSPSSSEANFRLLAFSSEGEIRTNEILDSMINKETIDGYYHVEAEEFSVMSELVTDSLNQDQQRANDSDDSSDEDSDEDDDSDEEEDDEDDEDDEDEDDEDDEDTGSRRSYFTGGSWYEEEPHTPYMLGDDGIMYDPESWAETHRNPWGTIDCGDGYVDDDGVFTEY